MHPDNVARLSPLVPKDRAVVAESGIKTAQDVERLKGLRISAILVGESLLKHDNVEEAVGVLVAAGKK
jgi:indole-3-glycerol phosphate synthase